VGRPGAGEDLPRQTARRLPSGIASAAQQAACRSEFRSPRRDAPPASCAGRHASRARSASSLGMPPQRLSFALISAPSSADRFVATSTASISGLLMAVGGAFVATLRTKTRIGCLPVGKDVSFRYRPVTAKGEGDWSEAIRLLIK